MVSNFISKKKQHVLSEESREFEALWLDVSLEKIKTCKCGEMSSRVAVRSSVPCSRRWSETPHTVVSAGVEPVTLRFPSTVHMDWATAASLSCFHIHEQKKHFLMQLNNLIVHQSTEYFSDSSCYISRRVIEFSCFLCDSIMLSWTCVKHESHLTHRVQSSQEKQSHLDTMLLFCHISPSDCCHARSVTLLQTPLNQRDSWHELLLSVLYSVSDLDKTHSPQSEQQSLMASAIFSCSAAA